MGNKRLAHALKFCASERIRPPAYRKVDKEKARQATRDCRMKYPQREKARQLAKYYLPEQPCTLCGETKNIHRHHEDYNKPLEIVFLCRRCHVAIHKNL